jgi:hypothetical protein
MTMDATPDDVLKVARNHGTRVAAEWSGWLPARVLYFRKKVDGYDRGRGRPSRAEMQAERPRMKCRCGFCSDRYISATVTGDEIAERFPSVRMTGQQLMARDSFFYAVATAVFGSGFDGGASDEVRAAGRRLCTEVMGDTAMEMVA